VTYDEMSSPTCRPTKEAKINRIRTRVTAIRPPRGPDVLLSSVTERLQLQFLTFRTDKNYFSKMIIVGDRLLIMGRGNCD